MARPSAESITQRAFDLGLLNQTQLQEVLGSLGSQSASPEEVAQVLVRRELLTNYQVDKLLRGDKGGFFYGAYKMLYLVGSGTFARVFRAVNRESGEVVAVKVLRSRFSENPVQYGLFVREGQLGRTLRHPNIVPIYEVFSQRPMHFFAMEFVEGQTLREFVKQRKIVRPNEAARIMGDITRGLQYAFERAVTHRDLKLSNVLISSRGQAKLVDFGLAAMDDVIVENQDIELPNTRAIDYAALERATGVRRDDTRSDIYFAGCMLYQMLSGTPPMVESKDRMARLNKSRFTDVVPLQKVAPQLPHYLTFVVKKAMDLDPGRRYQTPGDMTADLEMAEKRLGGEPNGSNGNGSTVPANQPDESPFDDPEQQPGIMVIESSTRMQDVFRSELKKAGYRVLLTGDPLRAVERLRKEPQLVDCVLFNAQEIGQSALTAFNQLADEQETKSLAAVLLLRREQRSWTVRAHASERRVVLVMPLKMRSSL